MKKWHVTIHTIINFGVDNAYVRAMLPIQNTESLKLGTEKRENNRIYLYTPLLTFG